MNSHASNDHLQADPAPPPALGAYAATRCPRRTHNDFDATIPALSGIADITADVQARIEAGMAFEEDIRRRLVDALGDDCIDLTELNLFGASAIAATESAMNSGMRVILGGQLPDDTPHGRRGRPDVLLRIGPQQGYARYLPVDIKRHKVLTDSRSSTTPVNVSLLPEMSFENLIASPELTSRKHERDALQLAHYWRMLQSCDRAPELSPVGGVIGTDELEAGLVVLWHDLTVPIYKTFSRSAEDGYALRSAIERYDHEFEFRSRIATVARERTGSVNDPLPLVEPVIIKECDTCPWVNYCREELGEFDASARIGKLSPREWLALRELGYSTVEHVAALDIAAIDDRVPAEQTNSPAVTATRRLLAKYLDEVSHIQNARRRLREAVMAGQMVLGGSHLRRITNGAIDIPRADVEIDFDIENDRSAHVYLWGMLVTDHIAGTSHFEHTTTWEELDAPSEAALALQFWNRLTEIVDDAARDEKSVLIYHYSTPEPSNLRRISATATIAGLPTHAEVDSLINETFVDLYPIMRANYFGRDGLGLKVAATRGAGFNWRDEDPGGLQSIGWLEQVRAGDTAFTQRVLEYNEDDVRATLALREWLSNQP